MKGDCKFLITSELVWLCVRLYSEFKVLFYRWRSIYNFSIGAFFLFWNYSILPFNIFIYFLLIYIGRINVSLNRHVGLRCVSPIRHVRRSLIMGMSVSEKLCRSPQACWSQMGLPRNHVEVSDEAWRGLR